MHGKTDVVNLRLLESADKNARQIGKEPIAEVMQPGGKKVIKAAGHYGQGNYGAHRIRRREGVGLAETHNPGPQRPHACNAGGRIINELAKALLVRISELHHR